MPPLRADLIALVTLLLLCGGAYSAETCHAEESCPPCPAGKGESFDAYIYRPWTPKNRDAVMALSSTFAQPPYKGFQSMDAQRYVKIPLHTFCCHSAEEQNQIEHAVDSMGWVPVNITLAKGWCTSAADGARGLHLGVDADTKAQLVKLTRLIRHYAGKETGIKLGPRMGTFRARIATVARDFDTDAAVAHINTQGPLETFMSQWMNVGAVNIGAMKGGKQKR